MHHGFFLINRLPCAFYNNESSDRLPIKGSWLSEKSLSNAGLIWLVDELCLREVNACILEYEHVNAFLQDQ